MNLSHLSHNTQDLHQEGRGNLFNYYREQFIKMIEICALASVAQWARVLARSQGVVGLIPDQDTYLDCRFDP